MANKKWSRRSDNNGDIKTLCTYGEKRWTWDDTTPFSSFGGVFNSLVISFHSCDFLFVHLWNTLIWPDNRFWRSICFSSKVIGIRIRAGSLSASSTGHDIWRIGLTKAPFSSKSSFWVCCTYIGDNMSTVTIITLQLGTFGTWIGLNQKQIGINCLKANLDIAKLPSPL